MCENDFKDEEIVEQPLQDGSLEDVAGGSYGSNITCPRCGQSDKLVKRIIGHSQLVRLYCTRCKEYAN